MADNVLQFSTRVDLSGAKAGLADLSASISDQMDAAVAAVESASADITTAFDAQSAAAVDSTQAMTEAYRQVEAQGIQTMDALTSAMADQADAAVNTASVQTDAVTSAVDIQEAAYKQLAAATLELATARRQVTDSQSAYLAGELPAADAETLLAEALERTSVATEQLALAKRNLAEVTAFEAGANRVEIESLALDAEAKVADTEATNLLSEAETRSAAASRGTVSARQAASAELRVLEGGLQGSTRAAGALLTMIPGLSAVLQVAFPVFGIIALVEIVSEAITKFNEMREGIEKAAAAQAQAFADLANRQQVENDALEITNDKLQEEIDKLSHHPGNGLQTMLDEATQQADKLQEKLADDRKELAKMLAENDPGVWAIVWSAITNDKGRTVSTSQQAKEMEKDEANLETAVKNANAHFEIALFDDKSKEALKRATDARTKEIHDAYQTQIDAYRTEAVRLSNETLGTDDSRIDNSTKIANAIGRINQLTELQKNADLTSQHTALEGEKAGLHKGPDAAKARLEEIETQFADLERASELLKGTKLTPQDALNFWQAYLAEFTHGTTEYRKVIDETIQYAQSAHELIFKDVLRQSPEAATRLAATPEEHERATNAQAHQFEEMARLEQEATKGVDAFNKAMQKQAEDLTHTGDRWDGYNSAVASGKEIEAANADALASVNDQIALSKGLLDQREVDIRAAARSTSEYSLKLQALREELARLQGASKNVPNALGGQTNVDPANAAKIQQVQNEIKKMTGAQAVTGAQDSAKITQDLAAPYLNAFNKIDTGWKKVQNDLIAGNKNIRQDFLQMGVHLVQDAAAATEKILADFIRHEILKIAAAHATAAATTATAATSTAATNAIETESLTATLSKEAVKAAAKSYSWAASWGGPIAGAIAAAVAFTGVESLAALAAFEQGGVVSGSPGMPVPIVAHAGERVLSTPQTAMFERMVNQSQPSNSSRNVNVNYSPTIHAFDRVGFRSTLQAHAGDITDIVRAAWNQGKIK